MFAPYTSITTNILFFDNHKLTDDVWFYRLDMPSHQKHFSKTKPMRLEHFAECMAWWADRQVIKDADTDTFKAQCFTKDAIIAGGYNLDLCGYPSHEEEVLSPEETIQHYHQQRTALNARIDKKVADIAAFIGINLDDEAK